MDERSSQDGGGQTLIMGYSADKSPLIGHLAGPLRRLEPLGAQRQEKCGPNRPTPTGYSCNNATPWIDGEVAQRLASQTRVYSSPILRAFRVADRSPERT